METISAWEKEITLILLLGWSNFAPILAKKIFGERFSLPVDFNLIKWFDGRPLFGPHKTWRGIFLSTATTAFLSSFTFIGPWTGAKIALFSLSGDLIASFIKRRLRFRSGQMFFGIDQGIESFLPLWLLKKNLGIAWMDILLIVLVFTFCAIILSPVLFKFKIRRNPF
jgi:CDP-2,3-bis-(O-geranylgeranyl)-sn-glycerol synthase